jgi:exopolysaccharide production protein ExoY
MKAYAQSVQPDLCVPDSTPLPVWKRALDIACSLAAMPVLLPLVTVIAMITKISSPGPVLFKQARVGYRGKQFLCYKFRTMKMNADTTGHQAYLNQLMGSNAPMVKLDAKSDPRLIPGGWILRATGLDELPQIINVLRGEMSLVGPRPCIPYEYENYTIWQKERFSSVPGLTGLWQVSGKNKTTFSEMIHFDIQYAKTKSLFLDVKIMALTFPTLVNQFVETRMSRKAAPVIAATPQVSSETASQNAQLSAV